ncbi:MULTISPECIES: UDP-N-acetylglucosamine 2-epimerase (non-hydrolyzing) [unclassified Devosia]|uniref:non-hydrolyzing UDP-N-acetylglucosamine 2-epimerase n=1 Tax=unclassified Devosia TaxID=196773 RepID=UPI00086977A7|nr:MULTISPECIES: UDP-N-acetylglucosamine 2-epimerase (non-hydrolyzing) [unclassified Devosia]MBN9364451.1 UDP-N-acetylglucosamine 2-epimerase (non-hydrolyzing) [Devosia sp.]ODS97854.1 MAG: UDP-N-acetylglucosamine 2-epimerase [Devosia sp. SCN 66-27]OJX20767.1 MAG: UDP-N-acetylglucosamine 2-epimerase [Devosia sp. 66-14]
MRKKILVVFGTRPEAIKMLPLVKALLAEAALEVRVCVTAQHREMLDQVLDLFAVTPEYDLDVMTNAQSLEQITAMVLEGLSRVLDDFVPDRVLVHGDTATAAAASLAAFYKQIRVGHVEAGLRSGDPLQPWPEEINRRIIDVIADQYYAPTAGTRDNLLREGARADAVHLTGNTVIDALLMVAERLDNDPALTSSLAASFSYLDSGRPLLLVTGHRRENFGPPLREICSAILDLARAYPMQVVYPIHPNPNVQGPVREMLSGVPHIHLVDPLQYLPFVYLMKRSHAILTDSGGIQEEAPSLGKPVFVTRNVTERPEAVAAGTVELVGTARRTIVERVGRVFHTSRLGASVSHRVNPYGDGQASRRIAAILVGRAIEEFSV